MKKIILFSAIIGCTLVAPSCNDLDQEPKSYLQEEQYYATANSDALANLTDGFYKSLWKENYGLNCRIMRINTGADDITTSPTKASNVLNYIRDLSPSATVNDADFSTLWATFYRVIYDSNRNIEYIKLPNDPAEAKKINVLLGESYFMRGLSYFYLVRLFGDTPFYLSNADTEGDMPRTAVAEIYEQGIVPDLLKAIELLDNTSRSGTSNNPSKWAAKACLADVYMSMAGWPLRKGAEYYTKAAEECSDIINNSGLSLTESYADLWKEALKTQANEHLFAIHNSVTNKMASQYGKSFYPVDFSPYAGWADYYANPEFMDKYPNDERKAWNYMTEWPVKKKIDGKDVIVTINYKDSQDGVPCISKYYNYDNGNPGQSAQSNGLTPIYRYADVLLMYAEATNLATGSVSPAALKALQEVQTRAKAPLTVTTNTTEFDDAVFAERGWEFVAEFKRWFDLVRREKLADAKPEKWAASVYKANNHYYLPIPYKQVDMTGWSNNAGY